MSAMKLTIFAAALFTANALTTLRTRATTDENPVAKVVSLLKEMKATAESEAKEDEEIYSKMNCWCETNDKEKTEAIKVAEKPLRNFQVPSKLAQLGPLSSRA